MNIKLFLKIIAAVFLFDLLIYPLFYFVLYPRTVTYIWNLIIVIIRFLGCCGIGLWFASHNCYPSVDAHTKRRTLLISAAAVLFGVVYRFSNLYIPLWDSIWYGTQTMDFNAADHPVRLFFAENLFGPETVVSYMCLLIVFQLGRFRFSAKQSIA